MSAGWRRRCGRAPACRSRRPSTSRFRRTQRRWRGAWLRAGTVLRRGRAEAPALRCRWTAGLLAAAGVGCRRRLGPRLPYSDGAELGTVSPEYMWKSRAWIRLLFVDHRLPQTSASAAPQHGAPRSRHHLGITALRPLFRRGSAGGADLHAHHRRDVPEELDRHLEGPGLLDVRPARGRACGQPRRPWPP